MKLKLDQSINNLYNRSGTNQELLQIWSLITKPLCFVSHWIFISLIKSHMELFNKMRPKETADILQTTF